MNGARVRLRRKQLKMTQTALGRAMGMANAQSYIGAIERNEVNVTMDTLERLAAALQVSTVWLLAEGDIEPPEGGAADPKVLTLAEVA